MVAVLKANLCGRGRCDGGLAPKNGDCRGSFNLEASISSGIPDNFVAQRAYCLLLVLAMGELDG